MSRRFVKRAAVGAVLVGAGLMTAFVASPAEAHPWNASNEGIYGTSAACYQAEARVEENYNVQWAGCEANPAPSWTLWVVW
jgi:hypothetical protein